MTCPIQPEPYFLAVPKIEESPQNSLSLRNPQCERTSYCLLLNSSSSIIHYEESHLVYGPLGSILLDQGILVKKQIRWSTRTTSYLLSFLWASQHTSSNPLLHAAINTLIQNLTTSLFFFNHLYFPSTFSEGITTNEIPMLPMKYQRNQHKTNLNLKTQ